MFGWIFSIIFIFYPFIKSYALENYNFQIPSKVYLPSEEIALEFSAISCSTNVKVLPKSDLGSVEIFDSNLNSWKAVGDSWEDAHYLTHILKIRILNTNNQKVNLSLVLQDTKYGKVYISDTLPIWISDAFNNYSQALNDNINSH